MTRGMNHAGKAMVAAMLASGLMDRKFDSQVDQKLVAELAMYAQERKRQRQYNWTRAHYKIKRRLKRFAIPGRSGWKGEQKVRRAHRKGLVKP